MAEVRVRDRPSAHDFRRGSIQFTLTTGGFAAAQESGSRREKDIVLWGNMQSRAEEKRRTRPRFCRSGNLRQSGITLGFSREKY
jgi:hypothetical protein